MFPAPCRKDRVRQTCSRSASPVKQPTSRSRLRPRTQSKPDTSVTLFDQGLVQVLEAAVTGLAPKQTYVLALATRPDGTGAVEPLTRFTTNPAGSAVVNAIGPIRQVVRMQQGAPRRYLVILRDESGRATGAPVQVEVIGRQ
jgi:hypothetical protein